MRLCFCSDIHGNGDAWFRFWEDVAQWKPDRVIFGGDVLGYYYDAEQILTDIRSRGQALTSLLGNHDEMFLQYLDGKRQLSELTAKYGTSYAVASQQVSRENIQLLRSLPRSLALETDGLRLGFFHGGPADPLQMRIYPDADLSGETSLDGWDYLFCGHTHHKIFKQARNCTVINPGSLGQPRDGQGHSYVIFDTEVRTCRFCVFSVDPAPMIRRIRSTEKDSAMAERLIGQLLRKRPPFQQPLSEGVNQR